MNHTQTAPEDKRVIIALILSTLIITAGLITRAIISRAPQIAEPVYGYVEGETLYPKAFVVLWRQDNNYCHLSDGLTQNEWVVYAEDFFEGDIIACTMGDMGTPDDISDDRMILHYYSGWNILTDTGSLDDYLP